MEATPQRRRWRRTGAMLQALIALVVAPAAAVFVVGRVTGGMLAALCNPWALQCWIALVVALVAFLLLRAWRSAIVALLLAAWASMIVLPHAIGSGADGPSGAPAIRVLETNVLASNAPTPEAINWIASVDADIIGVVECSFDWSRALSVLKERYPHQELHPTSDPSGIGLLSRHPLREVRFQTAPGAYFPHIEGIVALPSGDVRVLVVHPPPPVRRPVVELRDKEIAWLAEHCAATDVPTIILGDFNETQFGSAYRAFIARTGYRSARDGRLFATTWPATLPVAGAVRVPSWLRIAIDQCFVSRHFHPLDVRVGPDIGSDHLPIVIDVARTN